MVTTSPTSPISPTTISPESIPSASASNIHPLKAAFVPPLPVTTTTMMETVDKNAAISVTELVPASIPHLDGLEEVSSLDDVPLPYTILYHALVFKDEMPISILIERQRTGIDQLLVWIQRASDLVTTIEQTRLHDVQQLEPEVLDVISGLHRYEATVESSIEILTHLEEAIHPRMMALSSSEESLSDLSITHERLAQQRDQVSSVQGVRDQWHRLLSSITVLNKTVREHQRLRLGLQSVDNLHLQVREAASLLEGCLKAIELDRIEQQQKKQNSGGQITPTLANVRAQQQPIRGSVRNLLSSSSSSTALAQATNNDMPELESRMGLLSIQITSLQKSFPECKASLWARRRSSAASHSSQTTTATHRRRSSRQYDNKLRPMTTLDDASQPLSANKKSDPSANTATTITTTTTTTVQPQQNSIIDSDALIEQKNRLMERYCDLMAAWQELRSRKKKLWRDMEDLDRWRLGLSERSEAIVQMLVPLQALHQLCFKYLESLDTESTLRDEHLISHQHEQQQLQSPPQQQSSQHVPVHLRLYHSKSAHDELYGARGSRHQRQMSSYSARSSHSMHRSTTAPAALASIDPRQQRVLDTLSATIKELEEKQLNMAPSVENMFWVLESDLQLPSTSSAPPSPNVTTSHHPHQQSPQQPTSPALTTPVASTMPNSPGSPGQVMPPTPRVSCFNSVPVPFYPTADMIERHRALKEQWSELKTSLDQMGPRLSTHFSILQAKVNDALAQRLRKENLHDEGDNKTLVGSSIDGGGLDWRTSTSSSASTPAFRRSHTVGRQVVASPGWNASTRVPSPKWPSSPSSINGEGVKGRRRFMLITSEIPSGGNKYRPWCPSVSITSPGLPGFPQSTSTWGYFIIGPNGEIYPDVPRQSSPPPSFSPSSRAHTSPNLKDTRPPFSPGGNRPYTALSQHRPSYGKQQRAMSVQSNKNQYMKGGAGGSNALRLSMDGASEPNLPTGSMNQSQSNRDGKTPKLQQRRRGSKQTQPPGQLWIPSSGESKSSVGSSFTASSMAFMSDDDDDEYAIEDDDADFFVLYRSASRSRFSGSASSQHRVWSPASTTTSQYHPWSTNPLVSSARSSAALHATLLARGTSTSPRFSRTTSTSPPAPTLATSSLQQGIGRKLWAQQPQNSDTILAALSFTVPKFSMESTPNSLQAPA